MLITTTSAFAARCPKCGKMDFYALSLFAFADNGTHKIHCDCGFALASISTKDRKTACLQISCYICDSNHIYYYSFKNLWADNVMTIHCPETDFEITYIGRREKVKSSVRRQTKSLSELADDVGLVKFFDDASVMYALLKIVHNITEKGKLFCQCGNNNIEIETFSDHVDLHCPYCKAGGLIYGRTHRDLEIVKTVEQIELTSNGFIYHEPTKHNRKRHLKK